MAETAFEDSISEHAGSSTTATFFRSHDPLSQALRDVTAVNLDDMVRLNQRSVRSNNVASSDATSSSAIFTHGEESTVTKPTSTDTHPRAKAPIAKKMNWLNSGYTSSVSGNNGSASEAEVASGAFRTNSLFAIGYWADSELQVPRPLKGTIRARERSKTGFNSKSKKPVVVIEQRDQAIKPNRRHSDTDTIVATMAPSQKDIGKKNLRQRTPRRKEDLTRLAAEDRTQVVSPATEAASTPLSRNRTCALGTVVLAMGLTLALAGFGVHNTGKARLSTTKIIIFTATLLLACLLVLAMLIARRAVSEALLAGILEFSFGFALLVELEEFIWLTLLVGVVQSLRYSGTYENCSTTSGGISVLTTIALCAAQSLHCNDCVSLSSQ